MPSKFDIGSVMRKIDPVDRHVRLIRLSRQEPARQQVIFGYREEEKEKKNYKVRGDDVLRFV